MKFLSLFLVVVCLVGCSQADVNGERLSKMIHNLIAKREAPSPQNADRGAPNAEGKTNEEPSSKEAEDVKSSSSESSEDTEKKPESGYKDEPAFTPEFLEKLKPVVFSMIDEHIKDILDPETFKSNIHGTKNVEKEGGDKEETPENEKTTAATEDKETEKNKESETRQKRSHMEILPETYKFDPTPTPA